VGVIGHRVARANRKAGVVSPGPGWSGILDQENAGNPQLGQGGQGGQGFDGQIATHGSMHGASCADPPGGANEGYRPSAHRLVVIPDHSDHPDQAGRTKANPGQGSADRAFPGLTTLPDRYPWADDRAWILAVTHAAERPAKVALLVEWVAAAGGRLEGELAWLPPLGPPPRRRLAEVELRRMLCQFGVEVCATVEQAKLARVVAAAERAVLSPDALADPAELAAHGEPLP
jgi:hypothetical protein